MNERVPTSIRNEVQAACRQRCCVCYALESDLSVKVGGIAHIDQDRSNLARANLVFLCREHHKGFTSPKALSRFDADFVLRAQRDLTRAWADAPILEPAVETAARDPLAESMCELEVDPSESILLVQRYHGGDAQALNDLLVRYQARLRRIVRIKLGSRLREHLESVDIVQDVNLIAARKLDGFEARSPSSILNWLAQIALNQIRSQNDYFSAEKRDKELEVPLSAKHDGSDSDVGVECGIDPAGRPDERAANAELRGILDGCMVELPESYRDIILWRDYCGMSWQEVVRESGHPSVGAAQQQHRRAWIRLRRCVRPKLAGYE